MKTMRTAIASRSRDIFKNLALEDWLYTKKEFADGDLLMLWRNEPCVVVGRHQNPWLEANFRALDDVGVRLARRNSGGGAVFHDLGNLNLTFFTPRDRYDRKKNLRFITGVLRDRFEINAEISTREDIVVEGLKVSGTASKLGRTNAYHHCTLLVDANEENLRLSLKKNGINIRTNATKSISSKIANLKDKNEALTVDSLMERIAEKYAQDSLKFVDPTEENYPGLSEILEKFTSWEWIYGKTPKFTISTTISVPPDNLCDTKINNVIINLIVEKGIIENVSIFIPPGYSSTGISGEVAVITGLEGEKFTKNTLSILETNMNGMLYEKERIIAQPGNAAVVVTNFPSPPIEGAHYVSGSPPPEGAHRHFCLPPPEGAHRRFCLPPSEGANRYFGTTPPEGVDRRLRTPAARWSSLTAVTMTLRNLRKLAEFAAHKGRDNTNVIVIDLFKQTRIFKDNRSMSDARMNGTNRTNGMEGKSPFLIGVAGGTASGKSTVCKRIMEKLGQVEVDHKQRQVVTISQDSFYRELTPVEIAKAERGQFNFDHPDAFNDQLMKETLQDILAGNIVQIPTYDYRHHSLRKDEILTIYPADVVLFEGILVFYFPEVRELFHMKLFVDTDSDTRLARRVPRDILERGRDLDQVLNQYMNFVKPAFEEFCSPTKKFADVIIPRGADNHVAIDLIVQHIREILSNKSGRKSEERTLPSQPRQAEVPQQQSPLVSPSRRAQVNDLFKRPH